MDWKRFDSMRREVGLVELDLVESYARNCIGRRDFVKRGTIIGLSGTFMAAVISACSSDDEPGSVTTTTAGGTAPTAGGGGGASGGNLIIANQRGDANTGLDTVDMSDLGTYNLTSQSFEYLVGLGGDGNIDATALATSWSPNDDGSVWTFDLRPGVTWQSGGEFTSADVAATMDRLVAAGNRGLAGVIGEAAVDASDPTKAVFTLIEPNGNFPNLVSIYNAQTLITPVDYNSGTTLDARPDGTGAWKLDSFDPTTFGAMFSRNPDWWGGTTPLDTIELRGFADIDAAVTAMSSGEVDALQTFPVIGGEGLINSDTFNVLTLPSANHNQIWFNTQQGDYTDKLVRQAMAYCLDREQMVSTLWNGRADIGNDHPILHSLPFFDPDATPQRARDIDMAKALMAEAGVTRIGGTIECGDLREIPELAAIIQQNAGPAGFDLAVNVQANSTFYGNAWCPGASATDDTLPCDNAAGFGIVDYGHLPLPDIFLGSVLGTGGVFNSSNWTNAEFDQLFSNYRTSVDVASQKTAIGSIQKLLHEETPACYAYFNNYLSGHDKSVSGMQATTLGHVVVSGASKNSLT